MGKSDCFAGEETREDFEKILPDIERIAGHAFRSLDPEAREEAVAQTRAVVWRNWLRCAAKGKSPSASSLGYYGVLQVKNDRRLCGSSCTDVLSRKTKMLGRVEVQNLNALDREISGDKNGKNFAEALTDRGVWEQPTEKIRVKLDYCAFLHSGQVTDQERQVFLMLARGYRPSQIASQLGVSRPRVLQIKNALGRKLLDFFGPGIVHQGNHKLLPGSFVAVA